MQLTEDEEVLAKNWEAMIKLWETNRENMESAAGLLSEAMDGDPEARHFLRQSMKKPDRFADIVKWAHQAISQSIAAAIRRGVLPEDFTL